MKVSSRGEDRPHAPRAFTDPLTLSNVSASVIQRKPGAAATGQAAGLTVRSSAAAGSGAVKVSSRGEDRPNAPRAFTDPLTLSNVSASVIHRKPGAAATGQAAGLTVRSSAAAGSGAVKVSSRGEDTPHAPRAFTDPLTSSSVSASVIHRKPGAAATGQAAGLTVRSSAAAGSGAVKVSSRGEDRPNAPRAFTDPLTSSNVRASVIHRKPGAAATGQAAGLTVRSSAAAGSGAVKVSSRGEDRPNAPRAFTDPLTLSNVSASVIHRKPGAAATGQAAGLTVRSSAAAGSGAVKVSSRGEDRPNAPRAFTDPLTLSNVSASVIHRKPGAAATGQAAGLTVRSSAAAGSGAVKVSSRGEDTPHAPRAFTDPLTSSSVSASVIHRKPGAAATGQAAGLTVRSSAAAGSGAGEGLVAGRG